MLYLDSRKTTKENGNPCELKRYNVNFLHSTYDISDCKEKEVHYNVRIVRLVSAALSYKY